MKAYMTIIMLGGIKKPNAPPACTMPTASDLSYFFWSMAGTAITPMESTVAELTPSMAAINAHKSIVPMPNAPRSLPEHKWTVSNKSLPIFDS